jgi:spore germination protein
VGIGMKLIRRYHQNPKKKQVSSYQAKSSSNNSSSSHDPIETDLTKNLSIIQSIFSDTPDLSIKKFIIKQNNKNAALLFLSGLNDKKIIHKDIIYPLLYNDNSSNDKQSQENSDQSQQKTPNETNQQGSTPINQEPNKNEREYSLIKIKQKKNKRPKRSSKQANKQANEQRVAPTGNEKNQDSSDETNNSPDKSNTNPNNTQQNTQKETNHNSAQANEAQEKNNQEKQDQSIRQQQNQEVSTQNNTSQENANHSSDKNQNQNEQQGNQQSKQENQSQNNLDQDDSNLAVPVENTKKLTTWQEIEDAILDGYSVLFVDGQSEAIRFPTQGWPERSLEDSQIEPALKGAHIGFSESLEKNIAMIRRHVPNKELKIKELIVGKRARTKINILYLDDVVNRDVIKELEDRIHQIDIDETLNTGVLAELIEDRPYSTFPQLLVTERPDFAAYQLLQGRIITVVDRSPGVIVCPVNFMTFFESIDDYGTRWIVASFLRLMRYFAFFIAIFLPALYIAIITFHSEVIPIRLLISVGESRARVPFQPILEAIIMEMTLEMLREAGIRLPAPIGQTVGIVGGIVIGQAAVEAGIVSNIMVIVVALTAVASFIIPNYDMGAAIRILRFPTMILASFFGFLGIIVGLMIILINIITLESMGTPYGSPLAPLRIRDLKDGLIRFPIWAIKFRPLNTRAKQQRKAGNHPKGDSN